MKIIHGHIDNQRRERRKTETASYTPCATGKGILQHFLFSFLPHPTLLSSSSLPPLTPSPPPAPPPFGQNNFFKELLSGDLTYKQIFSGRNVS